MATHAEAVRRLRQLKGEYVPPPPWKPEKLRRPKPLRGEWPARAAAVKGQLELEKEPP